MPDELTDFDLEVLREDLSADELARLVRRALNLEEPETVGSVDCHAEWVEETDDEI